MSSALAIALETGTGDQVKSGRVPKFLRALQGMTSEVALPFAFAEYLRLARLPITINGDTAGWNRPGQGALFIGDHRNGLEYFLLLAALGQAGRKDIKIIGKPYALSVRLAEALDRHHEGYILPVIPRTLVSDKIGRASCRERV